MNLGAPNSSCQRPTRAAQLKSVQLLLAPTTLTKSILPKQTQTQP